uniref:Uncharacterized protein n=1 Tax=Fagus sylvatica TaxID=28930 RepID=A0A2N9EWM0_FAGSY
MAPPINPFKLMGKTADASSSTKAKGKGKGKRKDAKTKKKPKKLPEEPQITVATSHPAPEQEPILAPPKDPALLFGPNPISIRDTILDNCNADVSAQVAHGLAFAACLPEDMKQWAGNQPGPVFRQITRGLMMATQGVMSMEARVYRLTEKLQKSEAEHEKSMSEVLKVVGDNYKKLEDEHFRNMNIMKETEERVRIEETKRAQAEAEVAEMQEKMKELQSECVLSLGNAHKEGMEEGLKKGKELGREGAMDEVKAQFKMVYNNGFRHGWKSALNKTEQLEMSDLFLRANTPLPYPDAGLKDSDDKGEEEDEEQEGEQEKEEK